MLCGLIVVARAVFALRTVTVYGGRENDLKRSIRREPSLLSRICIGTHCKCCWRFALVLPALSAQAVQELKSRGVREQRWLSDTVVSKQRGKNQGLWVKPVEVVAYGSQRKRKVFE